jgi:hypothetical protein
MARRGRSSGPRNDLVRLRWPANSRAMAPIATQIAGRGELAKPCPDGFRRHASRLRDGWRRRGRAAGDGVEYRAVGFAHGHGAAHR